MPTDSPIYPAYPTIDALTPYKTGKPVDELARELGMTDVGDIVKLASNENPLGCSPKAIDAMQSVVTEAARYPDGSGYHLKQALVAHHASEMPDLAQTHITLGNGSNDVLELITRTFVSSHDSAVFSQYAFAVYGLATKSVGAEAIVVPAIQSGSERFGHDLVAMAKAIEPNTKVVFLANPNNPTGTCFSHQSLVNFLTSVPKDVLVVLDEAYVEYFDATSYQSSLSLLAKFPNLIITRTFSKAYGLASARVGYAVSDERIADYLNRLRQPFNVNSFAQAAAVAALADQAFIAKARTLNHEQMQLLTNALYVQGIDYLPSSANFITLRVGDGAGAGIALYEALLQQGVITRPLAGYGMGAWLRVSIGLPEENERFLTALQQCRQG